MTLTAELQRRIAGRRVRVFERQEDRHQRRVRRYDEPEDRVSTSITGGDRVGDAEGDRSLLFGGYVEVEYGGAGAWLGMRVDLWASGSGDKRFRSVHGVSWYSESHRRRSASRVPAIGVEEVTGVDVGNGTNAVAALLARVVGDVLASVRAANMQELAAMDSPRAKFEYELLQHHSELDVMVVVGANGQQEVLFSLPLLAGDDHYAQKEAGDESAELEGGSYLPRALRHPVVERGSGRTIISLRLVSAGDAKKSTRCDGDAFSWDVGLSWPSDLRLSSQVTQMERTAIDSASSIDIIGSCKQAFLSQWTKRRDFVGKLREKVIMLEYDPVDFSRAFFMLQEQLDPHAPLRVLVLSLAFTPEFFLTRCLADLSVRLLDGRSKSHDDGEGVVISLTSPSTDTIDAWEHDTPRLVAAFLECLQAALIRHLYGS